MIRPYELAAQFYFGTPKSYVTVTILLPVNTAALLHHCFFTAKHLGHFYTVP
jgi:hypothetical protein